MNKMIRFTVIENNSKQLIETYEGEYRNLMFLLKDKFDLEEFGECGGIGRCATCIIKVTGVTGISAMKERNEPVTLSKIGYEEDDIRLSCQLFITNDLNGAIVELINV